MMYRLQGFLYRLMAGRNGTDSLNLFLLGLYLVLVFLRAAVTLFHPPLYVYQILMTLNTVVFLLLLFRTFSKNLPKRRAENEAYLHLARPFHNRLRCLVMGRKDKSHKYTCCKNCGTICRVPRGKGTIEMTCPSCKTRTTMKS